MQRLRERMMGFDLFVFEQIRRQFQQNAAAWPRRCAGLRARSWPPLTPGDLVLEVLSGPVAA